jgi:hypothetical protein
MKILIPSAVCLVTELVEVLPSAFCLIFKLVFSRFRNERVSR